MSCCDDTGSGLDDTPIYGGVCRCEEVPDAFRLLTIHLADAAFAGTAATLKGQTHTRVNTVYVLTKDRAMKKMSYSEAENRLCGRESK